MANGNFLLTDPRVYPNIRAAAILTTQYVAATVIEAFQKNQLIIDLFFTKGSLTSLDVKVETSWNNIDYTQITGGSLSMGVTTTSLGTYNMTATGNYQIALPIMTRYIKISAQGNGTVTSSSLQINAAVGVS